MCVCAFAAKTYTSFFSSRKKWVSWDFSRANNKLHTPSTFPPLSRLARLFCSAIITAAPPLSCSRRTVSSLGRKHEPLWDLLSVPSPHRKSRYALSGGNACVYRLFGRPCWCTTKRGLSVSQKKKDSIVNGIDACHIQWIKPFTGRESCSSRMSRNASIKEPVTHQYWC